MKKLFALLAISCSLTLLTPSTLLAQNDSAEPKLSFETTESTLPKKSPQIIVPTITAKQFIPIGHKAEFSAEDSILLDEKDSVARFSWTFGEASNVRFGKNVFFEFTEPGIHKVKLRIKQGDQSRTSEKYVIIYEREAIMITDEFDSHKDVENQFGELIAQAGERGVWLDVIPFNKSGVNVSDEASFGTKIAEKIEKLKRSELIIFKTKTGTPLQIFAQWWKQIGEEDKFSLDQKLVVQITQNSIEPMYRIIQPSHKILQPEFILLTRDASLNVLFAGNYQDIAQKLKGRGIEFIKVDNKPITSSFLLFSRLINYFVANGMSQNVIYLLLAVPFIVFVIAFFRQFVGISTFGVFSPLMLTLSFMLLGLNFGFLAFLAVMLVSYLIRLIFDRVELLYIPKVALLFSAIAISFFLVLGLGIYFGASVDLALAVFPLLVMSTVSEKFVSTQSAGGLRKALLFAGETVVVSLVAFMLVQWHWLKTLVISQPETIVLPIIGLIWLGRFTGLRLYEYLKFRALFGEQQE